MRIDSYLIEERREKVLEFIKGYISDYGISPSVRDIASAVGIKSTSTVYSDLRALARSGRIRQYDKTSRCLVPLGADDDLEKAKDGIRAAALYCRMHDACNECDAWEGTCQLKEMLEKVTDEKTGE